MTQEFDAESLKEEIIQAIRTVYDPEIPINIYDLGLIYEINITPPGIVVVKMTLTTPSCPEAQTIPGMVESVVKGVDRVVDVSIELVWEPSWTKENMSEEARLLLGMF